MISSERRKSLSEVLCRVPEYVFLFIIPIKSLSLALSYQALMSRCRPVTRTVLRLHHDLAMPPILSPCSWNSFPLRKSMQYLSPSVPSCFSNVQCCGNVVLIVLLTEPLFVLQPNPPSVPPCYSTTLLLRMQMHPACVVLFAPEPEPENEALQCCNAIHLLLHLW